MQTQIVEVPVLDNMIEKSVAEVKPKQKKMQTMTKKTKKFIMLCGEMYSFDGEEAINRLLNYEKPKKEKKVKEPRKRKQASSNEEDKKKRGRPAKSVKVLEETQVDDIFANIVENDDVTSEEVITQIPTEKKEPKTKRQPKPKSEEEKAEKEAKKAQEKAEKEAKKAQEKAEKEAKKAQEKAEKEAKKAQEKADKPKKAAKKTTKKVAEKIAEKEVITTKVADTDSEKELEEEQEEQEEEQEEQEEEVFKVKKFEFNGVTYLRTRNGDNWHENGHIYNMDQDLVGFWNEKDQDIKFVEEGECIEEEYDE